MGATLCWLRLLSISSLLVAETIAASLFCWFVCPEASSRQAVCAVDSRLGARLFEDRCLLLRENHCQHAQYKEIELTECLKQYPHVVNDYVTANKYDTRFEAIKSVVGVRPLPRFMILMNVIFRLAATKPYLIPIMPTLGFPQLALPMWPALV